MILIAHPLNCLSDSNNAPGRDAPSEKREELPLEEEDFLPVTEFSPSPQATTPDQRQPTTPNLPPFVVTFGSPFGPEPRAVTTLPDPKHPRIDGSGASGDTDGSGAVGFPDSTEGSGFIDGLFNDSKPVDGSGEGSGSLGSGFVDDNLVNTTMALANTTTILPNTTMAPRLPVTERMEVAKTVPDIESGVSQLPLGRIPFSLCNSQHGLFTNFLSAERGLFKVCSSSQAFWFLGLEATQKSLAKVSF